MPTTPPTINAAPTAPQRGDKTTFSTRVDAFVTWLGTAVGQFGAVATNVKNNADEAFGSATAASISAGNAATSAQTAQDAATAASVTANATLWVSGQTVAQYANKISPIDHQTYRRKTATGVSTTDPSQDPANYVGLLAALTKSFVSADQTFTANGSLTIAHSLGQMPKLVLPFGRDTVTGRIYALSPTIDQANGTFGVGISFDAMNIYMTFAMNGNVPNGVYFVKALV